jgi:hypothetical protein
MPRPTLRLLISAIILTTAGAQSVSDLENACSCSINWIPAKNTLSFTTTGVINFHKPQHKNHFWDVPKQVSRIVIGRNVRVTGAFHTRADCTIEGIDRKTSVVYGTRSFPGTRKISGTTDQKNSYR